MTYYSNSLTAAETANWKSAEDNYKAQLSVGAYAIREANRAKEELAYAKQKFDHGMCDISRVKKAEKEFTTLRRFADKRIEDTLYAWKAVERFITKAKEKGLCVKQAPSIN